MWNRSVNRPCAKFLLRCADNAIVLYKDFISIRETKISKQEHEEKLQVSDKDLDLARDRLATSSMSESVAIGSFAGTA